MSGRLTMGVIVGNRGFFPDALAKSGREEMLQALERADIAAVALRPEGTKQMLSSACETDICGALSMHVLGLASQTPSALLDWNNNYGDDPDKVVCFHCGNLPKHFLEGARMGHGEIFAQTVGIGNSYGTISGRVKAAPMTFARISTDDLTGKIVGYVGAGRSTSDPMNTFGGAGAAEIPGLQALMHHVCENGLEHHVAANLSSVAGAVYEAGRKYMRWDLHLHQPGALAGS